MIVVEGKRPPKPENASDIGFSDPLWDFVEHCWDGKLELRPEVIEVVSQLGRAAAAWNRVMAPPHENVVPETPGPIPDSSVHCKLRISITLGFFLLSNGAGNIFSSSGDVDLQSPTGSAPSAIFDAQGSHSSLCTEPPLEEPEEVVEKPLEPPVESRPELPIEKPVAPFVEPQFAPRVRAPQRKEEPDPDLPVVYRHLRPDERSERPRSQLYPKERKSDDVSRHEGTNDDLVMVFPHLNENHKPPPSKFSRRKGCKNFIRKIFSFGRTKTLK